MLFSSCMDIRFTVDAVKYLNEMRIKFGYNDHVGVVIAPTSCTSCASNGFMVFEIGVWPLSDCQTDKHLILQPATLPDHMHLFVDEEFYIDSDEIFIVDYTKMGEIDLL